MKAKVKKQQSIVLNGNKEAIKRYIACGVYKTREEETTKVEMKRKERKVNEVGLE